ncbi:ABC transporter permease [Trinickia mobilis]|uniref:ABC transporter permease n=1 Tax=Trinickia mobilis TaxID=2816356 RepID=UPI001A901AE8
MSHGVPSRIADAGPGQAELTGRKPPRSRRKLVIGLRVALVLLVAIGWEFAARRNWLDPFFYSMPSAIALQLFYWFREGTAQGPLLVQLQVTFEEALLGLVVGSIAGAGGAIVLVRNTLLAEVFGFYIRIANALPLIVLGAIFVIALGSGMTSKIALAVVMAFFIAFGNAYQRASEVDSTLRGDGSTSAARRPTVPEVISAALRGALASLRMAFALALAGTLAGEFLGATQGIGCVIASSLREFNASGVLAAMIALGGVALIADYLLAALQRWSLMCRPQT